MSDRSRSSSARRRALASSSVPPQPTPELPERFEQLVHEMRVAWMLHHRDPTLNTRLRIGRFEGLQTLGHGSYGIVFKVHDPKLGRDVALKLFPSPGPDTADLFRREVQVLAKFSHPNIVRVYEAGEFRGDPFFVMELIEGSTGRQFVRDCFDIEEVLEVYEAAGVGLAVAHAEGVLHRDFKPSNVLLGDEGRVCVADFGLATLMAEDAEQPEGHRIGTREYMAPEILRGKVGDARSDQWSFCVALWETLYARRPFAGETAEELLAAIEGGEPDMGEFADGVPEAVRAVVRRGLSIDPDERYPGMWALIDELRRLRAGAQEPASGGEGRASRGSYLWPLAVGFAAVLGALGSAAALRGGESERELPPTREIEEAAEPTVADPVVQHVLGLIAADRLDEAHDVWMVEVDRRQDLGIATGTESLRISTAYSERAAALEEMDPDASLHAANLASFWFEMVAMDANQPPH